MHRRKQMFLTGAVHVGVFLICCFFFAVVYAAPTETGSTQYVLLEPSMVGGQTTTDASGYLSAIYTFGIGTTGALAVLMFAIGGIQYMFSGAAGSKAKAVGHMTNAVYGVILALAAWLILNTINPDLVNLNVTLPMAVIEGAPPGGGPGNAAEPVPSSLPTSLPTGCANYVAAFKNAAASSGVNGCLLYAIASQESGCNPGLTSSKGACGMMQFLPSTAGISCATLKSDPEQSIRLAANYLRSSGSLLSSRYGSTFKIGSSYQQSGASVRVGQNTYDAGNDDLIASYNAGTGTMSGSQKGPFAASSSCASRDGTIPVWQCDIDTAGYAETRNYVRRVQAYQRECLSGNALK